MADFMFVKTFDVGDTVTFTRSFKAEDFALRKKNRTYHNIFRGDEAVVTDVEPGSYVHSTVYTVRTVRNGMVLSGIPEFLID